MRMAKPISAPVPAQTRLFEHAPKWDSVDTLGGWRSACALILLYAAAAAASPAQTFTSLASFSGPNGAEPLSIVQGPDGNLWGTTFGGGGQANCGTVFKMTLAGNLSKNFTFNCTNGNEPQGLTLGTDGNFYGVTFFGGSNNGGTVFKLTPSRVLTTIFNFTVEGSGGSGPVGNLVEGRDGNFYGATYSGGSSPGYGTLFKITPSGTLTTLYQFDFTHGAQPYAGPVQGTDGKFYGTTYSGGAYGGGTAYKITPQGGFTLLYSFGGSAGVPSFPVTSLIEGTNGNFYGSTPYGGPDNDGTVFKITPTGALTVLHSFAETDGRWPGDLVQGTDGNFYGTTAYGGAYYSYGTIFAMTAAGAVTTLHSFNVTDGINPGQLIQDTNGTFYGMTGGGGDLNCDPSYGCGTVFSLATGLTPFVEAVPTSGSVGTPVAILGTNLKSTVSVSFNGTQATFTVVSGSKITTAVPSGATSGKVTVTTGKGKLLTKVPFRVTN
jgi:uncharacterized repeat protein (TIGR03803 family)